MSMCAYRAYNTISLHHVWHIMEAMAIRLEAIAIRLEAIAIRLEAIALRLETIFCQERG